MNKNILVNNFSGIKNIKDNTVRNIVLVSIAYIFLVIMSQVKIFLPFTPVPITGQTLAVVLIGLSFSRNLSAITLILYILSGTLGLPVFAGFKSGYQLFGPTGGYIIGFFFATQLCGYFAEKGWTKSIIKLIIVLLLSHVVIYFFGLLQLSYFIPFSKLFKAGLIPFIPGDIFKMVIALALLKSVWSLVNKK